jgi:hypothetical protein
MRGQGPGANGLLCPTCSGDSFSERTAFKTVSEPLLGSPSAAVVVDIKNCNRCGVDLPTVRGKRKYALLSAKRLSAIVADLEEAQRINSEMQALLDTMEKRSQSLLAEVDRCRADGEVSVIEERIAALEAETDGLEERRAQLVQILDTIASRAPAA